VARGYWNRSDTTDEVFGAVTGDDAAGPYLRSGDLGVIHEGELFVCGRIKDLIVIRGQNHFPQDIEATVAAAHPAFQEKPGAAFGCDFDGEERLVVVQELDRRLAPADSEDLKSVVQIALSDHHGLQAYEVCFVRPGSLPKTSSGKIRRGECRRLFLSKHWPTPVERPAT
jgi:acyl-CoA synthetase (AMP-forming)/AMP-acid ligase II